MAVAMCAWLLPVFGQPERVPASPADGFHHDYLLLLPPKVQTNSSFLVVTPTPRTSEDPAEFLAAAERIARNVERFLKDLGRPVLIPVLPRPPLKVDESNYINLYIPALSRAALMTSEVKLARMDLQVLAMLDHARSRIRNSQGVETVDRATFAGFSAAGHFATRMAVLHPERVLAVWAGGIGGHPVLPLAELEGRELTFPVGVADLEEIVGKAFYREAFSKISFMIVQGGRDTNTSLPSDAKPSDSYSFEQAELARSLLGTNPQHRLAWVKELYALAGANVEIKIYPEAGHQMTPEIVRDMLGFVTGHKQ